MSAAAPRLTRCLLISTEAICHTSCMRATGTCLCIAYDCAVYRERTVAIYPEPAPSELRGQRDCTQSPPRPERRILHASCMQLMTSRWQARLCGTVTAFPRQLGDCRPDQTLLSRAFCIGELELPGNVIVCCRQLQPRLRVRVDPGRARTEGDDNHGPR